MRSEVMTVYLQAPRILSVGSPLMLRALAMPQLQPALQYLLARFPDAKFRSHSKVRRNNQQHMTLWRQVLTAPDLTPLTAISCVRSCAMTCCQRARLSSSHNKRRCSASGPGPQPLQPLAQPAHPSKAHKP